MVESHTLEARQTVYWFHHVSLSISSATYTKQRSAKQSDAR